MVPFLAFIISRWTLSMDPSKIRVILDQPSTTSLRLVQHFLGFANFFQMFVQNFTAVAIPLTALNQMILSHFCWNLGTLEAFEELKRSLMSSPILQFPNHEEPFVIEADASDIGMGVVLLQ